ncbi:PAAR domain-containing protein [Photobacterium leiognathi]|uniref:PAAR domain-containing protein n=1 Tax=Photobacterium leiognathi TaxID=553611 RepID=UPI001EDE88F7|nr:PAAR domain-containing protein [Photobacterium leiognathi]MCG3884111.1 PAAR domain-containing protein [Photobacterium leiognathi]
MSDIAIKGSMCSGHGAWPPRPSISGQACFTVNGVPVMVTGDAFAPHAAPDNPPHGGTVTGTSHMTINGKTVAMVGDPVSCGSKVATGQPLFTIS